MPTVTPGQTFTGKYGEPFSQTPAFTGGPINAWSVTGLPSGLQINSSSGLVSGTPTSRGIFTPAVSYTFPFKIVDAALADDSLLERSSFLLTSEGRVFGYNANYSVPWRGWNTDPVIVQSGAIKISASGLSNTLDGSGVLILMSDGTVQQFLKNTGHSWFTDQLSTPFPTGLSNVVDICMGPRHAIVAKSDGTVVTWGSDYGTGVISGVPVGLSDVVKVRAGENYSLALKSDGTVVKWGANSMLNPPAGLSGVVAIQSSRDLWFALKSDGSVICVGAPYGNQPPSYGDTVFIASNTTLGPGDSVLIGIRSNGTMYIWDARTGYPKTVPYNPPGPITNASKVSIRRDWAIVVTTTHEFFYFNYENGSVYTNRIPALPLNSATSNIEINITEGTPVLVNNVVNYGRLIEESLKAAENSLHLQQTDATNRPISSWSATGLPSWVTLNSNTGAVTGTPTTYEGGTATLTATGPGGSDSVQVNFFVGPRVRLAEQVTGATVYKNPQNFYLGNQLVSKIYRGSLRVF